MAINRASQNWPETIEIPRVIQFTRELVIRNTAMLAPGLGLKYLAVIESHITGEFIAKKWYRNFPLNETIVVKF